MDSKSNNKIDDYWLEAIVNSFTSDISSTDQDKLNEWISHSADNKKYYDELKEIWHTLSILEDSEEFDYESAFQKFQNKTEDKKPKKIYHLKNILKYASIIALLLTGSYLINIKLSEGKEEQFALNSISVPNGSTSKIEFKDGSKIWMNSNTELELVKPQNTNERRIRLDGEAFLEVHRNEISPFTVETSNAEVKVLGTTFNVNAYSDEKELKVTLESGSVEIMANSGQKIQLTPGKQAVYDIATGAFSVKEVDLKKELIWKTNNLIFTGEFFEEIMELLENKFKVKIAIKNKKLLKSRFSGDFVKNESIEQILDIMSSNNRFKYTYSKKENTIQIY